MPKVRSSVLPTAFSSGCQKLGQPVPLSNLVSDENSGRSQPAQAKMPLRCSLSSGLEPGRSVPSLRRISYCCGVNCFRHSASVFSISNFSAALAGEIRSQRKAASAARLAAEASRMRRSIMMVSMARAVVAFWLKYGPQPPKLHRSGPILLTLLRGDPCLVAGGRLWADHGPPRRRTTARRSPGAGLAVGFGETQLAGALPGTGAFAITGEHAGGGGTATGPGGDRMAGNPAGAAAGPDQFEWRKQPPALVALQDATGDQLSGHRRGVQSLAAKSAGDPQAAPQLPDLRHAMDGLPDRTAPGLGDLDRSDPGKDRADTALDGAGKALRPGLPGGFRARPHQPVAVDDPEMINAVAVGHRPLKGYDVGESLSE